MASGYTVSGRGDLDTLFMARAGAARGNVGYASAGTDLAQRFEQLGASPPIANIGILSAGTDLASLFRSIAGIVTMTASANISGSTATAVYTLQATGDVFATQGGNNQVDVGDWLSPKSGMSGYQALATIVSGAVSGGTIGSWVALGGGNVSWSRSQATVGGITAVIDVQIRRASDSVIVSGTARITLQAVRTG